MGDLLPDNFDEGIVESQLRRAPAEALGEIAQLKAFLAGARGRFDEGRRDLVMGFATGYTPEAVRPFVESLLTAGRFRGEVVLFIRQSDVELADYLCSRGIRAECFEGGLTWYKSLVVARWFSYWDFLTARFKEGQIYRNILLTDVRDVIFQRPLFERRAEELEFHLEAASPKIGQCSWNSAWIRATFGEEALARMAERHISCAGVVSGRTSGILRYLAWMKILILSLSEEGRSWGMDQAIHNFVLYRLCRGQRFDPAWLHQFKQGLSRNRLSPFFLRGTPGEPTGRTWRGIPECGGRSHAGADGRITPLRKVDHATDLVGATGKHWKRIWRNINYVPIFQLGERILDELPIGGNSTSAVRALLKEATAICAQQSALRHDLMGRIYHWLLHYAKYLGPYYTAVSSATFLLKLALAEDWKQDFSDPVDLASFKVADLACGTGTLLMAAAQALGSRPVAR